MLSMPEVARVMLREEIEAWNGCGYTAVSSRLRYQYAFKGEESQPERDSSDEMGNEEEKGNLVETIVESIVSLSRFFRLEDLCDKFLELAEQQTLATRCAILLDPSNLKNNDGSQSHRAGSSFGSSSESRL